MKGELVQGGGVRGAPALPRGGTVLGLVQKDGRMVLDDTPLVDFKVNPARAVGVGSNLVVRTTMKFGYAYANEHPEIPAGKAGRAAIRYRFGAGASPNFKDPFPRR